MDGANHSLLEADYLLGLDDMCRLFDLTPHAIYNRRHRGDFPPAIKVGASLRWRVRDVEVWLDANKEITG